MNSLSQPPPPSQQPPQKVPPAAVDRAVRALLKWKSKNSSKNPQLLPSDDFFYLVLTLTKIPANTRVNAYRIPVPHPLYTPDNSELCLFVADGTSKSAKAKIETQTLPVSQVIKLTKLKKEYKAHEQKRKLCDSYDLFLAEKKIVPLLPNAIGKCFYKKKKIPVPVELTRENWKDQIDRVCSSAMLYLSTGTCSVIKVGRASMEKGEIVENILAAVEGVANVVPKKWRNVRSFHLKFAGSLALPIYQRVPEIGLKIGGELIVSGEQKKVIEEGKKSGKVKAKKEEVTMKVQKKKGRIHEVRYMDEVMIGDEVEARSESEGEEVVDDEEKEKEQEQEEEIIGKKRKKGDVEKKVKKSDKSLKKKKDLSGKKLKKTKVSV